MVFNKPIISLYSNEIFVSSNLYSILNLRKNTRIQGNLTMFFVPFSTKKIHLFLSLDELLIGIETGVIRVKIIKEHKKYSFFKFLFSFFKKSRKKKTYKLEKSSEWNVRSWREIFLVTNRLFKKNYMAEYEKKQYFFPNFKKLKMTKFPGLIDIPDFVNYKIFRDLWYRGFLIVSGLKFGATYLIYAGEINFVHASCSLISLSQFLYVRSHDVISFGRMNTTVRKYCILAFVLIDFSIFYFGIKWNNNLP
ncbi:tetrameric tRNA splicing endonuclease (nucleomorph) [Cryptomonas paramecium]|uniref:tRNA-intron lyase n=1 Tax=Cryptomonas paramaecium TaxID=2898 RepID=F2HI50_9CRYP|nr:tetrameric tRNA splicing endonuclease [Cryptomonas paramecium]AEA39113.1 tetrameric tRNA splicing endonuclease [Cryptomonas paramecium]|mmetsp:Transcript_86139/g.229922  ORF Transcript_86139/g.229922 Transcript_86139/m.229922 type:complete len:250 (+) Transcript_86139:32-781(+)